MRPTKLQLDSIQKSKARPFDHIVELNSSLWKRVIAWERGRAASGCGISWGDADQNKQGGI